MRQNLVSACIGVCLLLVCVTRSLSAQTVGRTNVNSQVTLGWTPPAPDPAITGYNLYQGVVSLTYTNVTFVVGQGTSQVTLTNSPTGFVRGTTYLFNITTVSTNGLESVYGGEIPWTSPRLPNPPGGFGVRASQ